MTDVPTPTVTREVDLEADAGEVWDALVADPERAGWLGGPTQIDVAPGGRGYVTDPDGTRRDVLVDEVVPGRRLTLDWWTETGAPSHVEFDIVPIPDGSRLTVTERPLVPLAEASAAGPVASALVGHLRTGADRSGPRAGRLAAARPEGHRVDGSPRLSARLPSRTLV